MSRRSRNNYAMIPPRHRPDGAAKIGFASAVKALVMFLIFHLTLGLFGGNDRK